MSHKSFPRRTLTFPAAVLASARDYVPALIEACGDDANPIEVLLETANYPKIVRKLDMVEFIVGWFHGVAECLGGDNVRETYLQLLEATRPASSSKRSAPAPSPPKAKAPPRAPSAGKRQRVDVPPPAELARPAPGKRQRVDAPAPVPIPAVPIPAVPIPAVPIPAPAPAAVTPPASSRGRRSRLNQPSLGF